MSSLKKELHAHHERFLARIDSHHGKTHNYNWLSHTKQNFRFQPDYLKLHQFAPTPFKQWLNKTIAPIPTLWNKSIWPVMRTTILSRIEQKYLPDLQDNHALPFSVQNHAVQEFLPTLRNLFSNPSPNLAQATFTDLYFYLNDALKTYCESLKITPDIYLNTKAQQNRHCLNLYRLIREEILSNPNAFELCCYIAIRANLIDCVEDNSQDKLRVFSEEINQILDGDLIQTEVEHNPYFQLNEFKKRLKSPQKIMYELDNSGEVIFDLLFIEVLLNKGHQLCLAAKGHPVLNDVTHVELTQLLQRSELSHFKTYLETKKLSTISTDSPIAGKYLAHSSESYKQAYAWSDILILKGQGNFHTMPIGTRSKKGFIPYPYAKPKIFMMMVKAPFIVACFNSLQKQGPKLMTQHPFLYIFDPQDKKTYPW